MPQFFKDIQEKALTLKPRDLVYPGIILVIIIIICILFYSATQFITKNINDAFSSGNGGSSSSLNMENYALVAKKLGISIESKSGNGAVATLTNETSAGNNIVATTTTQEPQVLDKKSITLTILNSTKQKGVASTLAQALETAGFAKATTGNQSKLIATTMVLIKESKVSFSPALLEEVQKLYPSATATTTAETSAFDATIIIGSK